MHRFINNLLDHSLPEHRLRFIPGKIRTDWRTRRLPMPSIPSIDLDQKALALDGTICAQPHRERCSPWESKYSGLRPIATCAGRKCQERVQFRMTKCRETTSRKDDTGFPDCAGRDNQSPATTTSRVRALSLPAQSAGVIRGSAHRAARRTRDRGRAESPPPPLARPAGSTTALRNVCPVQAVTDGGIVIRPGVEPVKRLQLCGNLLVREMWRTSAPRGMLDCNGADVSLAIYIKNRVFIKVSGLDNRSIQKLNEQGIGVGEVTNFHGVNLLSKKALCSVSPSGKIITRRNRFSISGTCTQRRMRPSAWTDSRIGARMARSIHSSRMIARSGR